MGAAPAAVRIERISAARHRLKLTARSAHNGAVHHKASVVTYLKVRRIKGRADNGNGFVPRCYNKITTT